MDAGTHQLRDVDEIWTLNQYRSAEIRGAGAIVTLNKLADSNQLRRDLTKHLRDEGNHAYIWARTIAKLGGEIFDVQDAYQNRLGRNFGVPRNLAELLALTLVSESRGVKQYQAHLDLGPSAPQIGRALSTIMKDEEWHVDYIGTELARRLRSDPKIERALERAVAADAAAIEEFKSTVIDLRHSQT